MLRFHPTEAPTWDVNVGTSHKLAQICTWTEQYCKLPVAAKEFVQNSYCRAAVAQCVLSANLSEETGLADLDSTQEVLQAATATVTGKAAQETKQLGDALQALAGHYESMSACQPQHSLEALTLTPDVICHVHGALMHDLVHNAGEYRNGEAYGGFAEGIFFYQPAHLIPSLLLTVCDLYNQSLRDIANIANQVPTLYHLAAVLFVQFVTVHPFSDGNGRLARLLASHVLRSVTPFPITPRADGTDAARKAYVGAIMAARAIDGKANSFLTLSAPADFAALLIHAGWESWKNCFDNLERLGFFNAHPLRGVLCAQTYGWSAYQLLSDVGLSAEENTQEHEAILSQANHMQHSEEESSEVLLNNCSVCVLYRCQSSI